MMLRRLPVLLLAFHLLALQVAGQAFLVCQEGDGEVALEVAGQDCCAAPGLASESESFLRSGASPLLDTCGSCQDYSLDSTAKLVPTRKVRAGQDSRPTDDRCATPGSICLCISATIPLRRTWSLSEPGPGFAPHGLRIATSVVMLL